MNHPADARALCRDHAWLAVTIAAVLCVVNFGFPSMPAVASTPATIDADLANKLATAAPGDELNVIILFRAGTSKAESNRLAEAVGALDVRLEYDYLSALAARLSAAQVRLAAALPFVESIALDVRVQATLDSAKRATGVDAVRQDFELDGNSPAGACGGARDYCADDATVAVVDTGIDAGHVDLDGGKVIGFVDCTSGTCTSNAAFDDNGHGTHVSSIIAGEGDGSSSRDLSGVAPGASLVGAKVLNARGSGLTSNVDAGIEWVIANRDALGIDEMNLSLGSNGSSNGTDTTSRLVNQAAANGIVPFVAAGNSGPGLSTVGSPGAAEFAVTVGAVSDPEDTDGTRTPGFGLADFSSRGPTADNRIKPDVMAPGVDINAAAANTTTGYQVLSGTSMATPFTAGVGALALSSDPGLLPSGTVCPDSDLSVDCNDGVYDATMTDGVKSLLEDTAADWGATGRDNDYGYGIIDAYNAVASVIAASESNHPFNPDHAIVAGNLASGESRSYTIHALTTDFPVAATMIIPGWTGTSSPNLNMELLNEACTKVAGSTGTNRQETIGVPISTPGTYTLRVYATAGSGDYRVDVSYPGTLTPSPEPSPEVTPTDTPSPEVTPTDTPSPEVTPTDTPSPEVTPTDTSSPEAIVSESPSPDVSPDVTPAVNADALSVSAQAAPGSLDVGGCAPPPPPPTIRASTATGGTQGTNNSSTPSISADGRFVTFASTATNLVPGDTNGRTDIFVNDTQDGTVTRVSTDSSGIQGNNNSSTPAISADGRFVAFASAAKNLFAGDTNGRTDIFVKDRQTGVTTRVSTDTGGAQPNNNSSTPTISGDGRYVTFASMATNLVTGDTNARTDIFVKDTQSGTTLRVSIGPGGAQGNNNSSTPDISEDGRYVTFASPATNLVIGDSNARSDIFVNDIQTGLTTRVSTNTGGTQANQNSSTPAISADGRFVTFASAATNIVGGDTNGRSDIFVKDTQAGTTTRASTSTSGVQGNNNSSTPWISGDGRYVTFASAATNLVTGDTNVRTDIFVKDMQGATITRASAGTSGVQGNNNSSTPWISGDGRYVAFASAATNLVTGDTNARTDIFVTGPLSN